MASIGKKGFIFIGIILLLLIISPFVAMIIANGNAKARVDKAAAEMSGVCAASYDDVRYNIWKRHLYIYDFVLTCKGEEIARFAELDFNHIVSGKPVPSNVMVDFSGGVINLKSSIFGKYAEAASDLGYPAVSGKGRLTYTLGPVSKEFKIVTFIFNADNIGVINAEAKVPDIEGEDIISIAKSVLNNKPAFLWVSFQNGGFIENLIGKYAESVNKEYEDARGSMLQAVYRRAEKSDNEMIKEKYLQAHKFLQNGSEISVKLDEDEDISLKELADSLDTSTFRNMGNSLKNMEIGVLAK